MIATETTLRKIMRTMTQLAPKLVISFCSHCTRFIGHSFSFAAPTRHRAGLGISQLVPRRVRRWEPNGWERCARANGATSQGSYLENRLEVSPARAGVD